MRKFFLLTLLSLPLWAVGWPISDFFNGTVVSPAWVQTLRGGSVAQVTGLLTITAPAGSNHDSTAGIVKLAQSMSVTGDFGAISKLTTLPQGSAAAGLKFQAVAMWLYQDDSNYMEFDVNNPGSVSGSSWVAHRIVSGTSTQVGTSHNLSSVVPYWMQIRRVGGVFDWRYSSDGTTWLSAGTFTSSMVINQLVIGSDNFNSTPASAVQVDAKFAYVCVAVNDACAAHSSHLILLTI